MNTNTQPGLYEASQMPYNRRYGPFWDYPLIRKLIADNIGLEKYEFIRRDLEFYVIWYEFDDDESRERKVRLGDVYNELMRKVVDD